jgi:Tol biopolymer transport system component
MSSIAGASWSGDRIVFAVWEGSDRGLWSVSASEGKPERLGQASSVVNGVHPSFLLGREAIVFASRTDAGSQRLLTLDLASGDARDLGIGGETPQYLSSGHLLWAQAQQLWAAAFDLDRLSIVGEPWPVMELPPPIGILTATFAASANGTVVTVQDPDRFDLVEIAADGSRHPVAVPPGRVRQPRLSRDGRWLAYTRGGVGSAEIWVREVATGRESKLAQSGASFPAWTADGNLVYLDESSARVALRLTTPGAKGEPSTIFEQEHPIMPWSVSPSGILLFHTEGRIKRLDIARPGAADVWLNEDGRHAAFSPDGRWVAYLNNPDGQVYVRPYPGPGRARQASVEGGQGPAWSADGRTLFFRRKEDPFAGRVKGELLAVGVRIVGDDVELGAPRLVTHLQSDPYGTGYAPKPDGSGFFAVERRDEPSSYTVVVNLGQQLREHDRAAGLEPR